MEELTYYVPLFFLIALIYSSAGFGGGSSYLAVLSLGSLVFTEMRMIALTCNIVVVLSSVLLFSKYKYIKWHKIRPLLLLSVPMAFLGGSLKLEARFFFLLLGVSLFISALLMLVDQKIGHRKLPRYSNGLIGGGIGLLSGMVGIGGGIFLSPLLHLTKWDMPKVIAATCATFIFVNSVAGLTGQIVTNGFPIDLSTLSLLAGAVFLGGQIGVRMTIFKLDPLIVKRITAILILIVSIRILSRYL